MKHLGINESLLVTIVSVTEGSQNKKRPLQPTSRSQINRVTLEPINRPKQTKSSPDETERVDLTEQGQRWEQLRAEIDQVINNLPAELSPNRRPEFASIINLLLAKRVVENVHGYERTLAFQRGFAETYARFLDTLESGTPTFKQEEIEEFANTSISAFERNEEQFLSFVENVVRTDPQLIGMSVLEVRKRLLQFSAWLYINDRKHWLRIGRITYIWPWCYSRNP